MAAAMMLADDGHQVTVLERDAERPPSDPEEAFSDWDRRSVAQFGLAHWLHARGTSILREQLPSVYRRLDENEQPQRSEVDEARVDLQEAVVEAREDQNEDDAEERPRPFAERAVDVLRLRLPLIGIEAVAGAGGAVLAAVVPRESGRGGEQR